MKDTFNTIDYIISHYTADDEYRPQMNFAHQDGEFIFASDSRILIKVPIELVGKDYINQIIPDGTIPNFEKFVNDLNFESVGELNINDLLPCIENIKIKIRTNANLCETCDGDGEIECECCGNSSDCKDCKGTGVISELSKIYVREVHFENEDNQVISSVSINGYYFNPVYMEILMFTMLALNFSTCEFSIVASDVNSPTGLFKLENGIEIILIGVLK